MYSLMRKSAVLLSILSLLPLANATAELKRVPLILMDTGPFSPDPDDPNNPNVARLEGTGSATHLGKIVSTGVFEKMDRPSGGFKGKIEGTATTVVVPAMATATSDETATAASNETATAASNETATAPSNQGSITYRLSAEFFPGAAPNVFYGVGTYRITKGTGDFEGARGFGEFIGIADFQGGTYNCFLRGVISY